MATPIYSDRVRETCTATGTSALTLNGAASGGYVSFFSAFSTTQTFEYEVSGESDWETGVGVMLDEHTLQRNSVIKSTNGDTFVDFTEETKLVVGKITGFRQSQIVEQVVRWPVRNETGGTLTKLTAVTISGYNTTEDLPLAILADKDSGTTRPGLGLVEADISNNANGYVVQHGIVDGANTSGWSDRDVLFLGDAGALTTTAPSAGQCIVMGWVVRSHASAGILAVSALPLFGLLQLSGGTMTGSLAMGNFDLTGLRNSGYGAAPFDAGDKTGSSQNINWTNGNFQKCRLTGNVSSSTFTAPPAATQGLALLVAQDGTGGRTFAWPSNVIWDRVTAPTLSVDPSVVDLVCGPWDGTNYRLSFWKGSA